MHTYKRTKFGACQECNATGKKKDYVLNTESRCLLCHGMRIRVIFPHEQNLTREEHALLATNFLEMLDFDSDSQVSQKKETARYERDHDSRWENPLEDIKRPF